MSTLYLIDAHTPVVANSRIVGVQQSSSLITNVVSNGCFPVFVPSGIDVGNPTTVGELNTAKFAALQSMYGGSNIVYETFLQNPDIAPGAGISIGDRVTTHYRNAALVTNPVAISYATNGTLVFDAFTKDSELDAVSTPTLRDGRRLLSRISELDDALFYVTCIFNVGDTPSHRFFNGVTQPTLAPLPGTALTISFGLTGVLDFDTYIGSWAFIY